MLLVVPYTTLSSEVKKLINAQRSDTLVKEFRAAVRDGTIEATYLPAKFALPKTFSRHGEGGSYTRHVRDMAFEATPAFAAWFDDMNRKLAGSRRTSKLKPTMENIEAGLVDFKELAASTRAKMQSSFAKGQTLGQSRKGAAQTQKAPAKKRTTRTEK